MYSQGKRLGLKKRNYHVLDTAAVLNVACARFSDSIVRAQLGKGGGGGEKNALSLPSPRAFLAFLFTERLFTTISEPGTGYAERRRSMRNHLFNKMQPTLLNCM